MNFTTKFLIFLFFAFYGLTGTTDAQINKSQESNYKAKATKNYSYYKSVYDNGYVKLRDGTIIDGQISIVGETFNEIYAVRIKTNSGEKYYFNLRSLLEYGLSNSSVNDTPELFVWGAYDKNAFTGFKFVRTGSTEFGYVKLRSGETIEGSLKLRESNGKIENMVLRGADKKNRSFELEEVSNYGVQVYKDKKFNGAWSLINWQKSNASGMMVNIKSVPMKGYVESNDGTKTTGYIQLLKKAEMITQVHVRDNMKAKPAKIDHRDIKSYGPALNIDSYYELVKGYYGGEIENFPPTRRFFPGSVLLEDGDFYEGLVARTTDQINGDIVYAENETELIMGFDASVIEEVVQTIPDEENIKYEKYFYDITHVEGYLIQNPPQYLYVRKPEHPLIFETDFQPGFIILNSGEVLIGSLKITSQGSIVKYAMKNGDEKPIKYSSKIVTSHGLITHNAKTVFVDDNFSEPNSGFLKLMGSGERVEGELKIETKTTKAEEDKFLDEDVTIKTFIITQNGASTEYEEQKVERFGLINVPVSTMTNDGVIMYEDDKRNFHPGSFTLNGEQKNGYLAWAEQTTPGVNDAFYFAESLSGNANVYYLDDGATAVKQEIAVEFEAYDPADDSFLVTMTTETDVVSNGYVITNAGDKVEGKIEMSFPPKLWFASDLKLTKADGTVINYTNDGKIDKVYVNVAGKDKLFVYYENAYVEILHHTGDWVHFRNPRPTTPTFISGLLNYSSGMAMTGIQEYTDQKVAEYAVVSAVKGNKNAANSAAEYLNRDKTDFMSKEFFTLYAKEHMIMNNADKRTSMYIPGKNYQHIEGELMGSMEYLQLDKDAQKGLTNLNNPLETLKFLDRVY